MKLISVDDHIIEHPGVWQDRLPAKLREAGPRFVELEADYVLEDFRPDGAMPMPGMKPTLPAGTQTWMYEGVPAPGLGGDIVAGVPPEKRMQLMMDPKKYDAIRPGCTNVAERIKDMDIDGVYAQLGFPSWPNFSGTRFLRSKDLDLAHACVLAYNDFVIDEWCGFDPARLIPMVILPLWDRELCVAEIERCAAKGARAISFPENPGSAVLGLPSIHTHEWDRVLGAVEVAEMALCMHFGTSGTVPQASAGGSPMVMASLMGTNSMAAAADLVFSHVFRDFPGLKVSLAEGGIGWVPWLLQRIDYTWKRMPFRGPDDRPPSELFREHIYVCGIDDDAGIAMRDRIGVDHVLLESDYPHSDSMWPNTRKRVAEMLAEVPDGEAHKIAELNARALFGFFDA
jgi:predicted TIM-barrel fold metal-dependent hydrolase